MRSSLYYIVALLVCLLSILPIQLFRANFQVGHQCMLLTQFVGIRLVSQRIYHVMRRSVVVRNDY